MKERPILMSAPMVRGTLNDTKTKTRRLVATRGLDPFKKSIHASPVKPSVRDCYIKVGDQLWVRETWVRLYFTPGDGWQTFYRADDNLDYVCEAAQGQWRPSIHMPRAQSRLTLSVYEVRSERLQDITEEDAIAEGMQAPGIPAAITNRSAFARFWDEINAKRGYSWQSNPWVWVIDYRRVSP